MSTQKQFLLEACVGNYNEAKNAELNGAHRIELCENLTQGGTTPSYGTIKKCKESLSIPIITMIRPRAGNFVYSQEELEIMHNDIEICKSIKVQGIAIGVLTKDNKIDQEQMKKIIELAYPLDIVFHMAFDQIEDQLIGLKELIDLNVKRILTRGQKEGNQWNEQRYINIKNILEQTQDKVAILVGGGVTNKNWKIISQQTGAIEFHGTKIIGNL